jgi:HEAT repeat protein
MAHDDSRMLVAELEDLRSIFRVQGRILARGRAMVPALAAFLLGRPSVLPQARVAAAECLGALGGDDAVAALVAVLTQHDMAALSPAERLAEEAVRNTAARALGRIGSRAATDALVAALGSQRLIGAGAALAALQEARAIPGLVALLEEPTHAEAADLLASFGEAATVALSLALETPRPADEREAPVSEQRRALAAELLGRIAPERAAPALRAHLDDPSGRVRTACALALARTAAVGPASLDVLAASLDDDDFTLQKEAAGHLEAAGRAAIPALGRLLADERRAWGARSLAAALLGRTRATEALDPLARGLTASHAQVRQAVVRALAHFPDDAEALHLLHAARHDVAPAVRGAARELLGRRRR